MAEGNGRAWAPEIADLGEKIAALAEAVMEDPSDGYTKDQTKENCPNQLSTHEPESCSSPFQMWSQVFGYWNLAASPIPEEGGAKQAGSPHDQFDGHRCCKLQS